MKRLFQKHTIGMLYEFQRPLLSLINRHLAVFCIDRTAKISYDYVRIIGFEAFHLTQHLKPHSNCFKGVVILNCTV
jgi:hypothetical protein